VRELAPLLYAKSVLRAYKRIHDSGRKDGKHLNKVANEIFGKLISKFETKRFEPIYMDLKSVVKNSEKRKMMEMDADLVLQDLCDISIGQLYVGNGGVDPEFIVACEDTIDKAISFLLTNTLILESGS